MECPRSHPGRRPAAPRAAAAALGLSALSALALLPFAGAGPDDHAARGPIAYARSVLARDDQPARDQARVERPGGTYLVLHLEFKDTASCGAFCDAQAKKDTPACHVFSRFEEFADVMARPGDKAALEELQQASGLVALDLGGMARVPPPPPPKPATEAARGKPEAIVRGGLSGLTGKGVIVAVVDSGVDFHHSDFVTEQDGKPTSRLLAFWDTMRAHQDGVGEPGPVKFPGGTPVGSVFSRDDLNRDLRGEVKLGESDVEGHGTACAGIACGAGKASASYTGVAPGAELVAVRVGRDEGLANAFLLNAVCGWLDDLAAKRGCPLVVSCSFGGHFGLPHGDRVDERQLSKRFHDHPGRLICVAAGNEGYQKIHAGLQLSAADGPVPLAWRARSAGDLDLYVAGAGPDDVKAEPDDGVRLRRSRVHPLTGTLVLQYQVSRGSGKVRLSTTRPGPLQVDAYLPECDRDGEFEFLGGYAANADLICSPGAARGVLTVGSYDFDDAFDHARVKHVPNLHTQHALTFGELSDYSNAGYVDRSGSAVRAKPDLAAPGRYFTAPAGEHTHSPRDRTRKYCLFAGTSASTPYVAGVCALLLEKKKDLTVDGVRKLLAEHATRDEFTGDCPNHAWGYGKLDVAAVERLIKALP
jgi:subtilisin family serine protease